MRPRISEAIWLAIPGAAALVLVSGLSATAAEPGTATRGMVASVHRLATEAGVAALQRGGNAVDAAVAAALTLGVVDGFNSGIGGGSLILVRTPDGRLVAIDGREMAPRKAHRDMFLRDGQAQPDWSRTGPLAVATPGALAAYDEALRSCGRLTLRDLLLPAAEIAETGFPVPRNYAKALADNAGVLARFSGSRAALLKADGSPYRQGEILRQADLARTYRTIAEQGSEWFYRGAFAATVADWMGAEGGVLAAEDFAQYRVRRREPLLSRYRGYTVAGFPPPSSGGVHVAQILNILQNFDLRGLHEQDPAQFCHVVVEAMKRAFADRAHWLGDSDFVAVPRGLVDDAYAAELARQIDCERARPVASHGEPPQASGNFPSGHTTHVAAADAEGFWVALTTTVNTTFGSKVIVPGTGVVLNNQMDDFSSQPGVPNAFGLIGAEANAVAPAKRPLSSMSPTIILRDGRPVMTLGAAGGPTIISQVVLTIVNRFDLEQELPAAVSRPRFHHQWSPDRILLEDDAPADLADRLAGRGHRVERAARIGVTQAIAVSNDGTALVGVSDPRVAGAASGW